MNNKEAILKVLNNYSDGVFDVNFKNIADEIEIILSEKYNEGYANGYGDGSNDAFSSI